MNIQKLKTTGLLVLFACGSFFTRAQTTDIQLAYTEPADLLLNNSALQARQQ